MLATRRRFLALSASLPVLAMLVPAARAKTPGIYADDGIAIDGTDATAVDKLKKVESARDLLMNRMRTGSRSSGRGGFGTASGGNSSPFANPFNRNGSQARTRTQNKPAPNGGR